MKIVTILGTLFFLIGGIQNVWAEDIKISIVEKGTNTPIEDVNVCWQLLQNHKKNGFGISDRKGALQLPIPVGKKAIIAASCIGYKTLVDTIIIKKINLLKLEKDIFNLKQVVVTGHSKPTPVDSSLYSVKVISKQKIRSAGATSLGDLFFTEPNINLSTDFVLGTKIEMFGMNGQNVKVMIDGVPVIGRLNGQIDLSQISIDNIDHIEIIEGPMSVVYGNNALAGTINVITNKKRYHTTELNIGADVESVGRYDGSLDIAHKIGKSMLTLSGNYGYFDGVDFDKSNRSMEWKPQQQYTLNTGYQYNFGKWNVSAKGTIYNSKVTMKGDVQDYKAFDAYYYTDRYTGSARIKGNWNENNNLSVLVSHSYYDRSSQEAAKDMTTLQETKGEKESKQTEKNTLMRAVWSHQFQPKKLSMETGLDFDLSSMAGQRIINNNQHLDNYAGFVNVRYSPWANFELQPGLRMAYNTKYDAPVLYSINAKWNIAENLSWRVSAAKGYRAPTVKELYFDFAHGSVKLQGKEDLKPEKSDSYNMALDYDFKWKENSLKFTTKLYYNDIYNMIALIQSANKDNLYQYNNINRYKTRGGSLGATFFWKDILRVNASGIVTSRYNDLSEVTDTRKFNTTVDFIAGLQVREPRSNVKLNADIKMYGKKNYFYASGGKIKEGNQEAYEMLNVSVNRRFLKNRLNITLGAKNLLDVKTVRLKGKPDGGAHTSSIGTPIAYGTSFFLKASFKISK